MSWQKTLEVYLEKAKAVRRGSVVLLPEAPQHVPVLCLDLEHMIGLCGDYEHALQVQQRGSQPIALRVEVAKVVEVDVPRKLLFIEEMPDGKLRLTCSKAFGIDVAELSKIEIERG